MSRAAKKTLFLVFIAATALALTPQEREFALKTKYYLEQAKEKARHEQAIQEEQIRRATQAEQTVDKQAIDIRNLSKDIDKAHQNEKELAAYNAKAKPIVDEVNKYWGIGAFFYGAKVLSRHIIIFALVGAAAILGLVILGFFFPAIGAFLSMIGGFLVYIMSKIGSIFRKKGEEQQQ